MKELERMAINELIKVYESYISKKEVDKELEENAKRVYNEYIPGFRFLRSTINEVVGGLFSLAYPNVDPERKVPTREEAKKILENLKKLKKEFN